MRNNFLEEVCEGADDQLCFLLVEELEVHNNNRAVTVIPTAHIDYAAFQQLLHLWSELHWKILLSPVLMLL